MSASDSNRASDSQGFTEGTTANRRIGGISTGESEMKVPRVGLEMPLTRDVVLTTCTRDSDFSITALVEGQTVSVGGRKPGGRTWTTLGGVETSKALAPTRMNEAIVKALAANILVLISCEGLV